MSITLASVSSSAEAASLRLAISNLPIDALQSINIHVDEDAEYMSHVMSELLGLETRILNLSIYCPDASLFALLERAHFRHLKRLKLRTSSKVFSTKRCAELLKTILRHATHTVKELDLRCAEQNPHPGLSNTTLSLWDRDASAPFDGMSCHLEDVTFRGLDFSKAHSFDWGRFGEKGLERLRISNCLGSEAVLSNLPTATTTWHCLHSLSIVLPDMRMQHNPTTLRVVEAVLSSLPEHSLRHLRVEIPDAKLLPNAECIARHEELESLFIGVTDSDGRWLAFHASDIEVIGRNCPGLHCLGLTFPPIDRCQDFMVRRFPS